MLQVPSEEEVLKISQAEAIQEVQWQNEAWKALLERKEVVEGEVPRGLKRVIKKRKLSLKSVRASKMKREQL